MALSKDLLEILACPQCKGEVTLVSRTAGGRARLQRVQAPATRSRTTSRSC